MSLPGHALSISWLWYPHFPFLSNSRVQTIIGSPNFLLTSNFQSDEWSFSFLQAEENQNCVPIFSLVHSQIESNSSHYPKTLQNWFCPWINSTTIKSILKSEYFFVIYIKNAITLYFFQNAKIWNPVFLFFCTQAHGLLMAQSTWLFPPIFNQANEASIHSPDEINLIIKY